MGVDSKVFVVCRREMAYEVGQAVKTAIDKWLMKKLDDEVQRQELNHRFDLTMRRGDELPDWSISSRISAHSFEHFNIDFIVAGEGRSLNYFIDCSCDTDDITEEHTLIFSIGHWGMHAEIMQVVMDAIRQFGDVWYDHNDCDNEDYERVY